MITVIKQGSTEEIIKELLAKLFKKKRSKGIDAYKYCGSLKLKEDALSIQKKLRDEWR
jgi:effector-binding domain-containing protein